MASSSGTSSGSLELQNSGFEEDLQKLMDQKKRKRMISNRESARRSRLRKQKQLDDLMAKVAQFGNENNQIITRMNFTTQLYLNIEAENSILRAQTAELSHRLQSLNEILNFLNANNGGYGIEENYSIAESAYMNQSCNSHFVNQQPIVGMADFLHY
ncbi:bZIP transcription factor 11-like [Olea europaea var. sylvestris]|uniref:BZIP transcription factor 11-like n=1 Tax=Olea europaea subsp. europaea TaxID=158383 RepID=A0A8S0SYN5_OLEEU|nr:bZIP transcription factor 11-like [Olea europaea var. sylvestris]CAA2996286.1 bZIP transcription factor 11-like [Olea europaea subsp. europaea]